MLRESLVIIRNHKTIIPLLVILVTASQLVQTIPLAWLPEAFPDYNLSIMTYVPTCHLDQYPKRPPVMSLDNVTYIVDYHYQPKDTRDPLKWYINCLSYKTTGSASFIPILFNVSLISLVYLLAVQLTKDKLIGLISITAFIPNPLYAQYVASGTYDQVWSFFLILAVYLAFRFKGTQYAIPSFIASLAAKSLGVLYLPVLIYSFFKSGTRQQNIFLGLGGFFVLIGILAIAIKVNYTGAEIGFFPQNIDLAVSQNLKMLWNIIPVLIVFVGINRLCKTRTPFQNKRLVGLWILSALMTTPLIYLFTTQFQFVYRFVPLAVFMSIYIGIVIVETGNHFVERKLG